MHLYEIPLSFALIGLALYTVLAGADFGAGLWQLFAGSGPEATRLRDHAHHSMAAVWEANHVWLIFVLTVVWTTYPTAFGSIASTLEIPLFLAALGIILRGTAYALRAGTSTRHELRLIDSISGVASILTPFSLGAAVGAIASRRVPVGNAAGHLFSSWLNPTSIVIGVLAVVSSAYLAAIFLAADASRSQDPSSLQQRFRTRGMLTGILSGAIALAGLAILHSDAHPLYHRLLNGGALAVVLVSMLAGIATFTLLWRQRYEASRYTAAIAVAATIAGWALAQQPTFLPGLSIRQAAAPHDVLVAVTVAVIAGGAILFPSLGLLFRLLLHGQLDHSSNEQGPVARIRQPHFAAGSILRRLAVACLILGIGLLTAADALWAHIIGVTALIGFVALSFVGLIIPELSLTEKDQNG